MLERRFYQNIIYFSVSCLCFSSIVVRKRKYFLNLTMRNDSAREHDSCTKKEEKKIVEEIWK